MQLAKEMQCALLATWDAIGMDCLMAVMDEGGEAEMTRDSVIEVVLDCDHLEQYGFYEGPTQAEKILLEEFRSLSHEEKVELCKTVFADCAYCI